MIKALHTILLQFKNSMYFKYSPEGYSTPLVVCTPLYSPQHEQYEGLHVPPTNDPSLVNQ